MTDICHSADYDNDIAVLLEFIRFPLDTAEDIIARFARLPNAVHAGQELS